MSSSIFPTARGSRHQRRFGSLALAALFVLAHVGSANANEDRLPTPPIADYTHVFTAHEPRTDADSMSAVLSTIAAWLTENFDLPAANDVPRVEFVSPARITAMRYGPLGSGLQTAPTNDRAVLGAGRAVVAVYDDATRTIYLPQGWSEASPADRSILVHEMVHHLQRRAQLKYYCPQEREKLAYAAQQRWLTQFDRSLESEFEIDPFTLLAQTSCVM
jgi:hypothetical protein